MSTTIRPDTEPTVEQLMIQIPGASTEAAWALRLLLAEVGRRHRKGYLSLKITVEPAEADLEAVRIDVEVINRPPNPTRGMTMWRGDGGELLDHDPDAPRLY